MPARLCNVACVQYGRITGESSSLMAARAVRSSVVAFWQRGGFLLQNFQGAGNGKYRLREGEHERPGHGEPASELRAAGCEKLYAEKEPGAKTDRPQLAGQAREKQNRFEFRWAAARGLVLAIEGSYGSSPPSQASRLRSVLDERGPSFGNENIRAFQQTSPNCVELIKRGAYRLYQGQHSLRPDLCSG
jgi:hypothetical protein